MINWEDIQTTKTSGQVKVKCPSCKDKRSDKSDKSLSVNLDEGLAKCHYCNDISIRDVKEDNFEVPPQNWSNYTALSDQMVKYFSSRGISQKTLMENRITEEKYYQPKAGSQVNNIVFNYFEGDTLVSKKYRSAKKEFTQSKNTKNIFYGINNVIGQKEAYIVEGEIDLLSLWEIGKRSVISLPNGAQDNDKIWEASKKYLSDIEKFYIATDNDEKGDQVAEKIAQRLGRYRCERIRYKGKDANEDLKEGQTVLEQSLRRIEKYPVQGTLRISDFKGGILNYYDKGVPNTIYPKSNGLDKLKDVFSVMMGQLTVVTGIPSSGKSNFLEWYLLNLVAENDYKVSFFSPEHHPVELHQISFMEKFYGRKFWDSHERITKTEVDDYVNWANDKIYITSPEGKQTPTWDFIFQTFSEQIYAYGINIFVIDAFNKVLFDNSGNQREQITEVLTRLTSFCQRNNVMVYLVAHPTKMQLTEEGKYRKPTLYDVSGSADFRNQTHNGFCIYRHYGDVDEQSTEFINLKTKYSFQGTIGQSMYFRWHSTGRYYPVGILPDKKPLVEFSKQTRYEQ